MGDGETGKKELSPIEKFFYKGKSSEEILEWRKVSQAKAKATRDAKSQALNEAKEKAKELLPQLLAEEMLLLDSEKYVPSNAVLEKIRKLLDNPKMTMEILRRTHFREMTEKGWEKLTRFLFKDQVSSAEDLGLQIIEQRNQELKRLEKTIKMLKKEIKLYKKGRKAEGKSTVTPSSLLELLLVAERDARNYRLDISKNIFKTNLDANKVKASTSIHVHTTVPRPEPKNITPKVQSLSELVDGN